MSSSSDAENDGTRQRLAGQKVFSSWGMLFNIIAFALPKVLVCCTVVVGFYGLDFLFWDVMDLETKMDNNVTMFSFNVGDWRDIISNLPEVTFAVVGIALSIVSLILQLSATRYNPNVVALFFRDPVSNIVLYFFILCCILCLWVNIMLGVADNPIKLDRGNLYLPRISIMATMIFMTLAALLIMPYFKYVFAFINPRTQIDVMLSEALKLSLKHKRQLRNDAPRRQVEKRRVETEQRQKLMLESVQNLSDFAMCAIHQKDTAIAFHAISSLSMFVIKVMESRHQSNQSMNETRLHRANSEQFQPSSCFKMAPAFESLTVDAWDEIFATGTWIEWDVLYSYNTLFSESLSVLPDVCQQLTISSLAIGKAAINHENLHCLEHIFTFFNTFLRKSINSMNVKTTIRVLNHYRWVAEMILEKHGASSWPMNNKDGTAGQTHYLVPPDSPKTESPRADKRVNPVIKIADRLKYYSWVAYGKKLYFVCDVIAFDLCTMCEVAHKNKFPYSDKILAEFLEVDRPAETVEQEDTLRGVRKAQIKLATYYLSENENRLAEMIADDMKDEPRHRMESIKKEIESIKEPTFWELDDRGYVFDYLEPVRRSYLNSFYEIYEVKSGCSPRISPRTKSKPREPLVTLPNTVNTNKVPTI